ncbi:MAG: hypothetical protein RMJ33_11895 [Saprospiraceae bacterium]|nr:hypothetical protein [Saprospiraceae bacterium]MDW8230532.1 hypothetical protein [Saprospiraceae bacterium]
MEKDNLHDELAESGASLLRTDGLKHPLGTPEGYLEHIEEAIIRRLELEGLRKRPSKRRILTSWRFALRTAAAAAAVLAIAWIAHRAWPSAQVPAPLPEPTPEEIGAYLQENPELIDPDAMNTALSESIWDGAAEQSSEDEPSWELFLRDLSPEEIEHINL